MAEKNKKAFIHEIGADNPKRFMGWEALARLEPSKKVEPWNEVGVIIDNPQHIREAFKN